MTSCPEGLLSYTIRSGDTLWQLSQRYFTTIDAILAVNPGLRPNNLPVGQTICIPAGRTPRPPVPRPPVPTPPPGGRCPVGLRTYTIQRNDTLWLLSQRFCTTVDTIMAVNPGLNPNNLRVGQTIWIPAGFRLPNMPSWFRTQTVTPVETDDSSEMTYCPEETYSYTLEPGDTLWMLSQRFQTSAEDIMTMNPGLNPANMFAGDVICIPIRRNNGFQPLTEQY